MASPSGVSSGSGSSLLQNSASEENLQKLMDQRKRKRMISNRESARRSRMRKQKHLDDLMAQVAQVTKENNQIITSVNVATQHFLNFEAENSILRAQVGELSHRLESLNEIISLLNGGNSGFGIEEPYNNVTESGDGLVNNSLSYLYVNQPIIASADMLHY